MLWDKGGSVGGGKQLLQNFHLRLRLQLLPSADLQGAAESKSRHLKRLVTSASSDAASVQDKENILQGLLRLAQQPKEVEDEAPNALAGDTAGALTLPSYRLLMASALQEDLEGLGWGEASCHAGTSCGSFSRAAGRQAGEPGINTALMKTVDSIGSNTMAGIGRDQGGNPEGPHVGAAPAQTLGSEIPGNSQAFLAPEDILGSYIQQQRQQQQHPAQGFDSYRAIDSSNYSSVTSTPSPMLSGTHQQRQQQQPAEASAAEEEVLQLRHQLADLYLRQQQQQRERATAAATAAALRQQVQLLQKEIMSLRLHCHGSSRLPRASFDRAPSSALGTHHHDGGVGRGSYMQQQEEEGQEVPESDAYIIQTLQRKVAVYRRELMLLSEQNARLRRHVVVEPPDCSTTDAALKKQ